MKYTGISALLSLLASTNAFLQSGADTKATTTQLFGVSGVGLSPGVVSKTEGWEIEKISPRVRIEGQSRHTYSMQDASKEVVQIAMKSPNGRPVDADVELWIGPDWTPVKVNCHSENASEYSIQTLLGTRNQPSNVEIFNNGNHAYPIDAACSYALPALAEQRMSIKEEEGTYLEGGAIKMAPIPSNVEEAQVLIETEGKQLNAMIEMLNGPNNVKVNYEIFTNNGQLNSLFVVFETPADGNAIRIRNLAPMEFPCKFYIKPTKFKADSSPPQWEN